MKLQDLKVGELYKCALSGEKVLVILTEPQKSQDPKTKKESIIAPVKAGKSVVRLDSGDYKFVYTELHDGQLLNN
jgi:precorrin-4 methylase|tara:strand:- start:240 stop:464 length:225 start_codon:yes stop_codon:yes gene_type:complete